jgi:hypothetical protein
MGAGNMGGGANPNAILTAKGSPADVERGRALAEGRRMNPPGRRGDDRQQLEIQRQQVAEQVAREQQARERAEAEARLRDQQARAGAAAQAGAGATVIQRGPAIEGPVRNAQGMPVDRPGRQRPDQDARRRDLADATRARQEQMAAFEREMAAAQETEARIRKDAEAARSTRGTEGDARLQEEARLRRQQEAVFEASLRDAKQQYQAQSKMPGRRQSSGEERQAEMISQFERARKQAPGSGRDQAIADFERRFQGQEAAPGVGVATGQDDANVLSYQELLNRLKQYQGGMV